MTLNKKIALITLLMIVFSLMNVVYADIASDAGGIMSGLDNADGGGVLESPAGKILGVINYVAVAVALGMIIIIGIKWMTAGAGGKAKVKETFLPYLIGAICVGAGTAIAKFAINLGQGGATAETNSNDNVVVCGCPTCDGTQKRRSGTPCGCAVCQAGICKCSDCK